MERDKNKLLAKRTGSKVKALHVSDFIALGSKPSRSQSDEPKMKAKSPILSTSSSTERKEAPVPSSSTAVPSKRVKSSGASFTPQLSRPCSQGKKESKSNQWDCLAIEVDSGEFVSRVLEAEDLGDDEKVESLLCGAVKKLKSSRAKPENLIYLGLQFLAKTRPLLFCSDMSVEAFCSLLKRDISVNFKTKGNNLVSVLAANILMAAYKDDSNWPDTFVNVYIEDSLGERVWVDHDHCKGFVDNILTAFNTKPIPKNMMAPERIFKPEACPSPPAGVIDEDETSCSSVNLEVLETQESISVFPRFQHSEETLAEHVLEVIKEHMSRRQPMEISRNTLRFLVSTSGLSEVRLIASQKLEMWLQNPKLTRPAQELLLAICLNCNLHNQHDIEVISQLVKIRIKAKPIINHYLLCMKELIGQNPENLSTLLKHAIYNELSNSRNPNNMQLLAIIFQHCPDKSAKVLADVFFDLLLNKDDYLRALRALLREIVRTIRHDLNFSVFCVSLLQERKDATFNELETSLKERVFLSITDLIVLSIFLGISPTVKEQYSSYIKGEKKDLTHLRNYQMQVATIERDSVWWLHTIVPKIFKPGRNDFIHSIHKILFMEQTEHYHNKDNWPTEGERMLMLRIASEVPLLEDTLMRVMVIGLSREHPLTATEALELADQLVKRAAGIYNEDFPVLKLENPELCDAIFNLCAYHYPENISLPQSYQPPHLAISEHYWKAWMMLLVIVSHNPSTFGEMAWNSYPMLRNMMEMCITNQFIFPPPTLAVGEKADEIRNRELQMSQMEKDRILMFETHLAAASASKLTITESSSLLLSKLISMDPHGPARRPPILVIEQLKALNLKLKLGDLLCRSRSPDFLLDIIQRQGTSQSMPWLSELVESSAGSFSMLPVQCLCEFLINETAYSSEFSEDIRDDKDHHKKKKKRKQEQLLIHLQKLLHEPDNDASDTIEVINYFMKRLSSQSASARMLACRGLQMVLTQPDKSPGSEDIEMVEKDSSSDYDWLLKTIPSLPHFHAVRSQISLSLRQACQIENDPATIAAYVMFLATNTPDHDLQDFADLALDMAQMIVERPTIVNTILPAEGVRDGYSNDFLSSISEILYKYLNEAKSPSKEVYSWSQSQDQILIQWPNGEAATMHILVVHAMIIVLTYGPPSAGSTMCFEKLLDNWFPKNSKPPKAFLVDTSEEALLLPDWLKLRMIRSSVDVLVDAALKDLDPSQLVLFIQSFGIPVSSMSKLLKTLDLAVEFDSFAVEQAVIDKSYMSQLVEVQHRRGATGGDKFAKLLIDNSLAAVDMETSSLPAQTRVIQRAPPSLPTAIDVESVSLSVLRLFGLDTSSGILSAKQEYDLFKGLQKAMSQDILNRNTDFGAINKFIETCEHLLASDLNVVFFQSLHRKSSYSSVLLRLATSAAERCNTSTNRLAERMVYVCHRIVCLGSSLKSPFVTVAMQFYNKNKPKETKKMAPWKEFIRQNKIDTLSSEHITKLVQLAEIHDPLRLEEVIQYLVKCAIHLHNTKPLMSAMTNITLIRLMHQTVSMLNTNSFNRSKFCFFVDWLECLEPNIVSSSFPDPQCQLLFSLIMKQNKPVRIPFRPYLLALLIHQSSWCTLQCYINMILNPSSSVSKFDPSSVLDFLHACIDIPKIWQGKYKKKCKRDAGEDVLALNRHQMIAVVDYVIEEASLKICGISDNATSIENDELAHISPVMESRMHLLMKCTTNKKYLIGHCVKHLVETISKQGDKAKLVSELLLHLYLYIPSVSSFIPSSIDFSTSCSAKMADYSAMDVITHTLLTSIARTDVGRYYSEKITDIDIICRKIASSHPLLLLRQFPMMATLLRGRVHFEFPVFCVRNHILLFNCFLGLMEILPPHIFKPEYTSDLHNILDVYMDMFHMYGPQKELQDLINRICGLLLQYLHTRPASGRSFITRYSSLLQDLSASYLDCPNLRLLLAAACLQYWGANAEARSESKSMDAFSPVSLHPHGLLSSIANKLTQGNNEDVLSALQELGVISQRKISVIENYVDSLKNLLQESNINIRTSAAALLMAYLKHYPKQGSQCVSAFLQCLESENRDVISSTLEVLPDFVVLAQEYASIFLQRLFNVGMLMSIDTSGAVKDIISLLITQTGC